MSLWYVLLFNISLNLQVRFGRRVILSLYVYVTTAAYDICLLFIVIQRWGIII